MSVVLKYSLVIIMLLILVACKSEQLIMDAQHENVFGTQFTDSNPVQLYVPNFKNKSVIITTHSQSGFMTYRLKLTTNFSKEKDTMTLLCFCEENHNFFVKNVEFKKGTYFIKPTNGSTRIIKNSTIPIQLGSQINTPEAIQNMLFKGVFKIGQGTNDIQFKDIEFKVLDLADTNKVKLVPMIKEEFWDNSFKYTEE